MIVADVGLESIPDNCNDCPYFSGGCMCNIKGSKIYNDAGDLIRKGDAGKDSSCPLIKLRPHYVPGVGDCMCFYFARVLDGEE